MALILNQLALCVALYTLTNIFSYPLVGTGFFWDWISRLRLNDTTLQAHHFFWTTFTYLGPFFWHHFLLITMLISENWVMWAWLLGSLYGVEVQDHLASNYHFTETFISYWNFNLLLTNNLNKYHPHIFYLSTCSLVVLTVSLSSRYHYRPDYFRLANNQNTTRVGAFIIAGLNSFALFLGSWWAFQEGTWGGWWNWDPSEVLGLLVLLIVLLITHRQWHYTLFDSLLLKLKNGVLIFVWVYIFTQLNFDLISHNFGNRFSFFFVNTLFYLDSLLVLTLLTWYLFANNRTFINQLTTYQTTSLANNTYLWLVLALSLLWYLLILSSFYPLFNYFAWQYLNLNLLNTFSAHSIIYYATLLILWGIFNSSPSPTSNSVTLFYFSLTMQSTTSLLTSWWVSGNRVMWGHLILITLISVNLLNNQLSFNITQLLSVYHQNWSKLGFTVPSTNSLILEDFWKEQNLIWPTMTTAFTLPAFMTTQTQPEVNTFLFLQTSNNFTTVHATQGLVLALNKYYFYPSFTIFYEILLGFVLWVLLYNNHAHLIY